jgi:hypothetical protein
MKLACKNARGLRAGGTIPAQFLSLLCNYCLNALPSSLARAVFQTVKFIFRGGLRARARDKALRLLRRAEDSRSGFSQYRHVQARHLWSEDANRMKVGAATHSESSRHKGPLNETTLVAARGAESAIAKGDGL